jgi:hypothetical protein
MWVGIECCDKKYEVNNEIIVQTDGDIETLFRRRISEELSEEFHEKIL